ncbi:hypothetical protein J6590_059185 [Homalodisca vitripennis]|nr:hypothetical protein J6590_059185 [Homalodisca vitripennis]
MRSTGFHSSSPLTFCRIKVQDLHGIKDLFILIHAYLSDHLGALWLFRNNKTTASTTIITISVGKDAWSDN